MTTAANHSREASSSPYYILSLDGGGAKGFYSLGVLAEIEALVKGPLCERFDLIYGTSTGAIIAALLGLGLDVGEITRLYQRHIVRIMGARSTQGRSRALRELALEVFGERTFADFKTDVGIVATNWAIERPLIFKSHAELAHGRKGTFSPGFGCTIADAVVASCSAFPFFDRVRVATTQGGTVELMDGGYCANNPALFAIADGLGQVKHREGDLRVVSVGVGQYPQRKRFWYSLAGRLMTIRLLQKTLNINGASMEHLRMILFGNVPTIRINEAFESSEMATDLLESDITKLNLLCQRGRDSFARFENDLSAFFSL